MADESFLNAYTRARELGLTLKKEFLLWAPRKQAPYPRRGARREASWVTFAMIFTRARVAAVVEAFDALRSPVPFHGRL
jgi:hypothetical protein